MSDVSKTFSAVLLSRQCEKLSYSVQKKKKRKKKQDVNYLW